MFSGIPCSLSLNTSLQPVYTQEMVQPFLLTLNPELILRDHRKLRKSFKDSFKDDI